MKRFALLLSICPVAVGAEAACTIETDIATVAEVRDASLHLAEFEDLSVRAAGGKVRCDRDAGQGRYLCLMDGPGVLYVEGGGAPAKVIEFTTDAVGEAHFYSSGDVSCGLKLEFDRYR